jgi:S1-C subfamily serine protease
MVRDCLPGGRARPADSGLGAFVQAFTVVLATWLVALPLASASVSGLSTAVRDSRLLGAMDVLVGTAVPSAHALPSRLRAMLSSSSLASDSRRRARAAAAVGAPDQSLAARAAVRAASDSVLKIRGKAHRCQRALEGSGFVVAPNRVATNAHVVAGTDELHVEVPGSDDSLDAKVVLFNPMVDVAILEVSGLKATPLAPAANTARVADDAVELGYPLDGPLTTTPARVRGQIDLSTKDIYNSSTVVRDVYTLRAVVQSGNSGGPLITPDGALFGMIFGTDPDHPDNGYALTVPQIAPMLGAAPDLHKAVSTGGCGA